MKNSIYYKLKLLLFNLLKSKLSFFFRNDLISHNYLSIKIQSTSETLNLIEHYIQNNLKGVYMRFGDGDIFLYKNISDSYQKNNYNLSIEMKEALQCSGKNVHKCLAIHSSLFGKEEGMFEGNHLNSNLLSKRLLSDSFEFFIGSNIYSPVALHFIASKNVQKANLFLKSLKSKTKLFIGNKNIKEETKKKLFGSVKHIKTPSRNAYDEIERVYKEAKLNIETFKNFGVVVVAMGCAGRPLMKRLFRDNFNVYLFDFGSLLDGIDGINSRTWLKVNKIDYKALMNKL